MNWKHRATDINLKGMNALHRAILKVSGGRLLDRPLGMPTVELHTVGRKSGAHRSTLLTAPIHDDDKTVLIASKGGDDRNPEWYLNLVANPEVELDDRRHDAQDDCPHRIRSREGGDVAADRRRRTRAMRTIRSARSDGSRSSSASRAALSAYSGRSTAFRAARAPRRRPSCRPARCRSDTSPVIPSASGIGSS